MGGERIKEHGPELIPREPVPTVTHARVPPPVQRDLHAVRGELQDHLRPITGESHAPGYADRLDVKLPPTADERAQMRNYMMFMANGWTGNMVIGGHNYDPEINKMYEIASYADYFPKGSKEEIEYTRRAMGMFISFGNLWIAHNNINAGPQTAETAELNNKITGSLVFFGTDQGARTDMTGSAIGDYMHCKPGMDETQKSNFFRRIDGINDQNNTLERAAQEYQFIKQDFVIASSRMLANAEATIASIAQMLQLSMSIETSAKLKDEEEKLKKELEELKKKLLDEKTPESEKEKIYQEMKEKVDKFLSDVLDAASAAGMPKELVEALKSSGKFLGTERALILLQLGSLYLKNKAILDDPANRELLGDIVKSANNFSDEKIKFVAAKAEEVYQKLQGRISRIAEIVDQVRKGKIATLNEWADSLSKSIDKETNKPLKEAMIRLRESMLEKLKRLQNPSTASSVTDAELQNTRSCFGFLSGFLTKLSKIGTGTAEERKDKENASTLLANSLTSSLADYRSEISKMLRFIAEEHLSADSAYKATLVGLGTALKDGSKKLEEVKKEIGSNLLHQGNLVLEEIKQKFGDSGLVGLVKGFLPDSLSDPAKTTMDLFVKARQSMGVAKAALVEAAKEKAEDVRNGALSIYKRALMALWCGKSESSDKQVRYAKDYLSLPGERKSIETDSTKLHEDTQLTELKRVVFQQKEGEKKVETAALAVAGSEEGAKEILSLYSKKRLSILGEMKSQNVRESIFARLGVPEQKRKFLSEKLDLIHEKAGLSLDPKAIIGIIKEIGGEDAEILFKMYNVEARLISESVVEGLPRDVENTHEAKRAIEVGRRELAKLYMEASPAMKARIKKIWDDSRVVLDKLDEDNPSVTEEEIKGILNRLKLAKAMAEDVQKLGGQPRLRDNLERIYIASLDALAVGDLESASILDLAAREIAVHQNGTVQEQAYIAKVLEYANGMAMAGFSEGGSKDRLSAANRLKSTISSFISDQLHKLSSLLPPEGKSIVDSVADTLGKEGVALQYFKVANAVLDYTKGFLANLSAQRIRLDSPQGKSSFEIFNRGLKALQDGKQELAEVHFKIAIWHSNRSASESQSKDFASLSELISKDPARIDILKMFSDLNDSAIQYRVKAKELGNTEGGKALAGLATELERLRNQLATKGHIWTDEARENRISLIKAQMEQNPKLKESIEEEAKSEGVSIDVCIGRIAEKNLEAEDRSRIYSLIECGNSLALSLPKLSGAQRKEALEIYGFAVSSILSGNIDDGKTFLLAGNAFVQFRAPQFGRERGEILYICREAATAKRENGRRQFDPSQVDIITVYKLRAEYETKIKDPAKLANVRAYFDLSILAARRPATNGFNPEFDFIFSAARSYAELASVDENRLQPDMKKKRKDAMDRITDLLGNYQAIGSRSLLDIGSKSPHGWKPREGTIKSPIALALIDGRSITESLGSQRIDSIKGDLTHSLGKPPSDKELSDAVIEEGSRQFQKISLELAAFSELAVDLHHEEKCSALIPGSHQEEERKQKIYSKEKVRLLAKAEKERKNGNEMLAQYYSEEAELVDGSFVRNSVENSRRMRDAARRESELAKTLQAEADEAPSLPTEKKKARIAELSSELSPTERQSVEHFLEEVDDDGKVTDMYVNLLRGLSQRHAQASESIEEDSDLVLEGVVQYDRSITRIDTLHREAGRGRIVRGVKILTALSRDEDVDTLGRPIPIEKGEASPSRERKELLHKHAFTSIDIGVKEVQAQERIQRIRNAGLTSAIKIREDNIDKSKGLINQLIECLPEKEREAERAKLKACLEEPNQKEKAAKLQGIYQDLLKRANVNGTENRGKAFEEKPATLVFDATANYQAYLNVNGLYYQERFSEADKALGDARWQIERNSVKMTDRIVTRVGKIRRYEAGGGKRGWLNDLKEDEYLPQYQSILEEYIAHLPAAERKIYSDKLSKIPRGREGARDRINLFEEMEKEGWVVTIPERKPDGTYTLPVVKGKEKLKEGKAKSLLDVIRNGESVDRDGEWIDKRWDEIDDLYRSGHHSEAFKQKEELVHDSAIWYAADINDTNRLTAAYRRRVLLNEKGDWEGKFKVPEMSFEKLTAGQKKGREITETVMGETIVPALNGSYDRSIEAMRNAEDKNAEARDSILLKGKVMQVGPELANEMMSALENSGNKLIGNTIVRWENKYDVWYNPTADEGRKKVVMKNVQDFYAALKDDPKAFEAVMSEMKKHPNQYKYSNSVMPQIEADYVSHRGNVIDQNEKVARDFAVLNANMAFDELQRGDVVARARNETSAQSHRSRALEFLQISLGILDKDVSGHSIEILNERKSISVPNLYGKISEWNNRWGLDKKYWGNDYQDLDKFESEFRAKRFQDLYTTASNAYFCPAVMFENLVTDRRRNMLKYVDRDALDVAREKFGSIADMEIRDAWLSIGLKPELVKKKYDDNPTKVTKLWNATPEELELFRTAHEQFQLLLGKMDNALLTAGDPKTFMRLEWQGDPETDLINRIYLRASKASNAEKEVSGEGPVHNRLQAAKDSIQESVPRVDWKDQDTETADALKKMKSRAKDLRVAGIVGEIGATVFLAVFAPEALPLFFGAMGGQQIAEGISIRSREGEWTSEAIFSVVMGGGQVLLMGSGSMLRVAGAAADAAAVAKEGITIAESIGARSVSVGTRLAVTGEEVAVTSARGSRFVEFFIGQGAGPGLSGTQRAIVIGNRIVHAGGVAFVGHGAVQFVVGLPAMIHAYNQGDIDLVEIVLGGVQSIGFALAPGLYNARMSRPTEIGVPKYTHRIVQYSLTIFGVPLQERSVHVMARDYANAQKAFNRLPPEARQSYSNYLRSQGVILKPAEAVKILTDFNQSLKRKEVKNFEEFVNKSTDLRIARYETIYGRYKSGIIRSSDLTHDALSYIEARERKKEPIVALAASERGAAELKAEVKPQESRAGRMAARRELAESMKEISSSNKEITMQWKGKYGADLPSEHTKSAEDMAFYSDKVVKRPKDVSLADALLAVRKNIRERLIGEGKSEAEADRIATERIGVVAAIATDPRFIDATIPKEGPTDMKTQLLISYLKACDMLPELSGTQENAAASGKIRAMIILEDPTLKPSDLQLLAADMAHYSYLLAEKGTEEDKLRSESLLNSSRLLREEAARRLIDSLPEYERQPYSERRIKARMIADHGEAAKSLNKLYSELVERHKVVDLGDEVKKSIDELPEGERRQFHDRRLKALFNQNHAEALKELRDIRYQVALRKQALAKEQRSSRTEGEAVAREGRQGREEGSSPKLEKEAERLKLGNTTNPLDQALHEYAVAIAESEGRQPNDGDFRKAAEISLEIGQQDNLSKLIEVLERRGKHGLAFRVSAIVNSEYLSNLVDPSHRAELKTKLVEIATRETDPIVMAKEYLRALSDAGFKIDGLGLHDEVVYNIKDSAYTSAVGLLMGDLPRLIENGAIAFENQSFPKGSRMRGINFKDGAQGAFEIEIVTPDGKPHVLLAKMQDLTAERVGSTIADTVAGIPAPKVLTSVSGKSLSVLDGEKRVEFGLMQHMDYYEGEQNVNGRKIKERTVATKELRQFNDFVEGNPALKKMRQENPEQFWKMVMTEYGYCQTGLMSVGFEDGHGKNIFAMLMEVSNSDAEYLRSIGRQLIPDGKGGWLMLRFGRIDTDSAASFGSQLSEGKLKFSGHYNEYGHSLSNSMKIFLEMQASDFNTSVSNDLFRKSIGQMKDGGRLWYNDVGRTSEFQHEYTKTVEDNLYSPIGIGIKGLKPTESDLRILAEIARIYKEGKTPDESILSGLSDPLKAFFLGIGMKYRNGELYMPIDGNGRTLLRRNAIQSFEEFRSYMAADSEGYASKAWDLIAWNIAIEMVREIKTRRGFRPDNPEDVISIPQQQTETRRITELDEELKRAIDTLPVNERSEFNERRVKAVSSQDHEAAIKELRKISEDVEAKKKLLGRTETTETDFDHTLDSTPIQLPVQKSVRTAARDKIKRGETFVSGLEDANGERWNNEKTFEVWASILQDIARERGKPVDVIILALDKSGLDNINRMDSNVADVLNKEVFRDIIKDAARILREKGYGEIADGLLGNGNCDERTMLIAGDFKGKSEGEVITDIKNAMEEAKKNIRAKLDNYKVKVNGQDTTVGEWMRANTRHGEDLAVAFTYDFSKAAKVTKDGAPKLENMYKEADDKASPYAKEVSDALGLGKLSRSDFHPKSGPNEPLPLVKEGEKFQEGTAFEIRLSVNQKGREGAERALNEHVKNLGEMGLKEKYPRLSDEERKELLAKAMKGEITIENFAQIVMRKGLLFATSIGFSEGNTWLGHNVMNGVAQQGVDAFASEIGGKGGRSLGNQAYYAPINGAEAKAVREAVQAKLAKAFEGTGIEVQIATTEVHEGATSEQIATEIFRQRWGIKELDPFTLQRAEKYVRMLQAGSDELVGRIGDESGPPRAIRGLRLEIRQAGRKEIRRVREVMSMEGMDEDARNEFFDFIRKNATAIDNATIISKYAEAEFSPSRYRNTLQLYDFYNQWYLAMKEGRVSMDVDAPIPYINMNSSFGKELQAIRLRVLRGETLDEAFKNVLISKGPIGTDIQAVRVRVANGEKAEDAVGNVLKYSPAQTAEQLGISGGKIYDYARKTLLGYNTAAEWGQLSVHEQEAARTLIFVGAGLEVPQLMEMAERLGHAVERGNIEGKKATVSQTEFDRLTSIAEKAGELAKAENELESSVNSAASQSDLDIALANREKAAKELYEMRINGDETMAVGFMLERMRADLRIFPILPSAETSVKDYLASKGLTLEGPSVAREETPVMVKSSPTENAQKLKLADEAGDLMTQLMPLGGEYTAYALELSKIQSRLRKASSDELPGVMKEYEGMRKRAAELIEKAKSEQTPEALEKRKDLESLLRVERMAKGILHNERVSGNENELSVARMMAQDPAYRAAVASGNEAETTRLAGPYMDLLKKVQNTKPVIKTSPKGHVDVVQNSRQIIAIGDIHGDAYGMIDILLRAGVLEDKYPNLPRRDTSVDLKQRFRLKGSVPPGTQIVFMGDLIDRGSASPEVLEFVSYIQGQAKLSGNATVHVIRGNHEALFLRFFELFRDKSHSEVMKALSDPAARFDFSRFANDPMLGPGSPTVTVNGVTRPMTYGEFLAQYGIDVHNASLSDVGLAMRNAGLAPTILSIIEKYGGGNWEQAVAKMSEGGGTIDFMRSTKGAVVIDGNMFVHGGPIMNARDISSLDSYYDSLFSDPHNHWAWNNQMNGSPGQNLRLRAGPLDHSVDYVEREGWHKRIESQDGQRWMHDLGINHIYVGHDATEQITAVSPHVTNLDARLSEAYGALGGVLIIDPLHKMPARVITGREGVPARGNKRAVPARETAEVDFSNGRKRTDLLTGNSIAESVEGLAKPLRPEALGGGEVLRVPRAPVQETVLLAAGAENTGSPLPPLRIVSENKLVPLLVYDGPQGQVSIRIKARKEGTSPEKVLNEGKAIAKGLEQSGVIVRDITIEDRGNTRTFTLTYDNGFYPEQVTVSVAAGESAPGPLAKAIAEADASSPAWVRWAKENYGKPLTFEGEAKIVDLFTRFWKGELSEEEKKALGPAYMSLRMQKPEVVERIRNAVMKNLGGSPFARLAGGTINDAVNQARPPEDIAGAVPFGPLQQLDSKYTTEPTGAKADPTKQKQVLERGASEGLYAQGTNEFGALFAITSEGIVRRGNIGKLSSTGAATVEAGTYGPYYTIVERPPINDPTRRGMYFDATGSASKEPLVRGIPEKRHVVYIVPGEEHRGRIAEGLAQEVASGAISRKEAIAKLAKVVTYDEFLAAKPGAFKVAGEYSATRMAAAEKQLDDLIGGKVKAFTPAVPYDSPRAKGEPKITGMPQMRDHILTVESDQLEGSIAHGVKPINADKAVNGEFFASKDKIKPQGLWFSWGTGWDYYKENAGMSFKGRVNFNAEVKSKLKLFLLKDGKTYDEFFSRFDAEVKIAKKIDGKYPENTWLDPKSDKYYEMSPWQWLKMKGYDGVAITQEGYADTNHIFYWDAPSIVIFDPQGKVHLPNGEEALRKYNESIQSKIDATISIFMNYELELKRYTEARKAYGLLEAYAYGNIGDEKKTGLGILPSDMEFLKTLHEKGLSINDAAYKIVEYIDNNRQIREVIDDAIPADSIDEATYKRASMLAEAYARWENLTPILKSELGVTPEDVNYLKKFHDQKLSLEEATKRIVNDIKLGQTKVNDRAEVGHDETKNKIWEPKNEEDRKRKAAYLKLYPDHERVMEEQAREAIETRRKLDELDKARKAAKPSDIRESDYELIESDTSKSLAARREIPPDTLRIAYDGSYGKNLTKGQRAGIRSRLQSVEEERAARIAVLKHLGIDIKYGSNSDPLSIPQQRLEEIYQLIFHADVEGQIRKVHGFENATITGISVEGNGTGTYGIKLKVPSSAEEKTVWVKPVDGRADQLGARLIEARGVPAMEIIATEIIGGTERPLSYKVSYKDPNNAGRTINETKHYSIVLDVHDKIGTEVTYTDGGETRAGKATSVALLRAEVLENPGNLNGKNSEAIKEFYRMLSTPEGTMELLRKFYTFQEANFKSGLGDTHDGNIFLILVDGPKGKELVFGRIDTDPVGLELGVNDDGSPNMNQFALDSAGHGKRLLSFLSQASVKAASVKDSSGNALTGKIWSEAELIQFSLTLLSKPEHQHGFTKNDPEVLEKQKKIVQDHLGKPFGMAFSSGAGNLGSVNQNTAGIARVVSSPDLRTTLTPEYSNYFNNHLLPSLAGSQRILSDMIISRFMTDLSIMIARNKVDSESVHGLVGHVVGKLKGNEKFAKGNEYIRTKMAKDALQNALSVQSNPIVQRIIEARAKGEKSVTIELYYNSVTDRLYDYDFTPSESDVTKPKKFTFVVDAGTAKIQEIRSLEQNGTTPPLLAMLGGMEIERARPSAP